MARPTLALRVYDLLLRKLASQAWAAGSRCPSIRELARDLKMSPQPIHVAFRMAARNRLLAIHAKRRTVVLSGAGQRARELLTQDRATIHHPSVAVLIPEEFFPLTGAPFQQHVAKTVTAAAAARNWQCRVVRIPAENQSALARRIVRQFDAGFVIDPSPRKLVVLFALADYGFPMLSFNRQVPGLDLPVLTTNDHGASRQLGQLMMEQGHRNLCFIATPKHEYLDIPKSAINGWIEFLEETGLMDSCTMPLAYYKTPQMFSPLMERLLRLTPTITGFVLDVPPDLAFLAHDPRFDRLRIPGDISIAAMSSVAGIPWPSRHPPVTSFEVDWERAGRCAVEMIEQMLSGNPHPKSIRVPLNIHLTESIGPAPQAGGGL